MKDGFVKVAAATPQIRIGDINFNRQQITETARALGNGGAKLIAFPEMCLTGYTIQDLVLQNVVLERAQEALLEIARETSDVDALIVLGMPLPVAGAIYNVAAVLSRGEILGFVPKRFPDRTSMDERCFTPGESYPETVVFAGMEIPLSTDLLFSCAEMGALQVAVCVGREDMYHIFDECEATARATAVVVLAADPLLMGRRTSIREELKVFSDRHDVGIVYACAGTSESSTDAIFGYPNMIFEDGSVLKIAQMLSDDAVESEIDVEAVIDARRRGAASASIEEGIPFHLQVAETTLTREYAQSPFIPQEDRTQKAYCEQVLRMQAAALARRMRHIGSTSAVIGISGGLDSTLALLATVRAFHRMQLPLEDIICVTMPGFGTTDRTYDNACKMVRCLGATLREIPIAPAMHMHFKDIDHDENDHNVTYENAQARERTQILMDIANDKNAIVVGTGDLSELALGWATYNGDHMSMYSVNASIPKTVVRLLVAYASGTTEDMALAECLADVAQTPVSPELLPSSKGEITQKTEDIVGPYELHDFFLYYTLVSGFSPRKLLRIAKKTFANEYDALTIRRWMDTFYRRFVTQQFKRSCLPDGPNIGPISLSPRGALHMPSDAATSLWREEIEKL